MAPMSPRQPRECCRIKCQAAGRPQRPRPGRPHRPWAGWRWTARSTLADTTGKRAAFRGAVPCGAIARKRGRRKYRSHPQSSTWLTMPSASLGSNQVDFGGMIAAGVGHRHQVVHAAWERARRPPPSRRNRPAAPAPAGRGRRRRNRCACRCAGRRCRGSARSGCGRAASPAGARSASSSGTSSGCSFSRYQRPSRYMPNSRASAGRTGEVDGDDGEALARSRQQLLGRAAVEVAHHAVVVEDGHGVVREDHARK